MNKRLFGILAGILALAAIAAGCGGGEDTAADDTAGGSSSGPGLTKAELIKQGDGICEEGNKAIEEEANEFAEENGIDTSSPTPEQQEEVIAEVVSENIRGQGESIAELVPPAEDAAQIEELVEAIEAAADSMADDPGQVLEGEDPFTEANKLAKDYGFKVCSEA